MLVDKEVRIVWDWLILGLAAEKTINHNIEITNRAMIVLVKNNTS